MIEKIIKKYGGRFISGHIYSDGYSQIYEIFDTSTGETFEINIDSFNVDIEVVLQNILDEKIIDSRDKKIDNLINGDKT